MSFAMSPKPKLIQQGTSESREEKYPNECPLWLNIVDWSFVLVLILFI
ncbi:hypothetical protein ACSTIV_19740 [Vibrio parahaemolyticus]